MSKLLRNILNLKSMKMAIIVRTDLKMTKGKTCSQVAHGAVLCYQESLKNNPGALNSWLRLGQPKVVLKASSQEELENLHAKSKEAEIISVLVCDAGKTQIKSGTMTVLGVGPDLSEKIDLIVQDLKLL